MQKLVPNAIRSLTIKVHTIHRVMANDCLHNLLVKQTNNFTRILLLLLFNNNNNNNFINYSQSQGVRILSPSATSSLNINSNRSLTLLLSSHRHYWKQRVDESKEEDQNLIVDEV